MTRFLSLMAVLLCVAAPQPASAQSSVTLEQAVHDALAQNPSLKAARLGTDAAAAGVDGARAAWFPRVSFAESWQRGDQPVFVFSSLLASRRFAATNFAIEQLNHPDAIGYFHSTASVEQVLFDGGVRKAAVDTARTQAQIAGLSAGEAALSMATQVTTLYGQLLATDAETRAASAALEAGRDDLTRATHRRDAGMATEADVLALHVHVAALEQRVIQADGNAVVLRAQLNRAMGAPVERTFAVVEPSPATDSPLPNLADLLREAQAARPELQRAAATARLADDARRAARAAFLPKAAAQAAFDVSGNRVNDRTSSWLVGGELRWSLGVAGGERAQVRAAAAAASQARAEADDVLAQVQVDVVTALQQLQSARARQAVGRAAVAQARESQRIIRDRFDAGLAPVTDVLGAASAILDAERLRVSALVDQLTGAAQLNRALGRLP